MNQHTFPEEFEAVTCVAWDGDAKKHKKSNGAKIAVPHTSHNSCEARGVEWANHIWQPQDEAPSAWYALSGKCQRKQADAVRMRR